MGLLRYKYKDLNCDANTASYEWFPAYIIGTVEKTAKTTKLTNRVNITLITASWCIRRDLPEPPAPRNLPSNHLILKSERNDERKPGRPSEHRQYAGRVTLPGIHSCQSMELWDRPTAGIGMGGRPQRTGWSGVRAGGESGMVLDEGATPPVHPNRGCNLAGLAFRIVPTRTISLTNRKAGYRDTVAS